MAPRLLHVDSISNFVPLASAMPLLEENISDNAAVLRSPSAVPQAAVLDWDEPVLPIEVDRIHESVDVIM